MADQYHAAHVHKAIVLYPPSFDIRVETIPIPKIEHPDDAIVKIQLSGLCGSDLHLYRGTEELKGVATCGHEFIGEVVALGSSFKSGVTDRPGLYSSLSVGDKIVSPFTVSCGECHPCRIGFTCRCVESRLFGTPTTSGGQAQYVRVPKAGGTLYNLSDTTFGGSVTSLDEVQKNALATLTDSSLLLLCDILPTGVFAAFQALNHPKILPMITGVPYPLSSSPTLLGHSPPVDVMLLPGDRQLTFAVVGLGPVGMCACISLLDQLSSRGLDFRIVAVDPVESRQAKMRAIFSTIVQNKDLGGNLAVGSIDEGKLIVEKWTAGRGCNAVLEVVGNNSALSLSYALVRPFGVITSVGVHAEPPVPYRGRELYDKNVSLDFGRCPVRSMFPEALKLLLKRQDIFGSVGQESSLVDRIESIDKGAEMYDLFDKGKCGKVLFDPWK